MKRTIEHMYYLTYRPQTIGDIDNTQIREKLKSVLSGKGVPHALLFTGPKGVGKTSAARIVAKVLNCTEPIANSASGVREPCNKCHMCRAIATSSAVDVIELDAASHRKIDDVRELIKNARFAPVYAAYKVYIIDEVHMLTKESFNALLKTLEEPPPSTVFILATTELEKLPKTIVSRCMKCAFDRAKKPEILHMLQRIVAAEKLSIPTEALTAIAEHSEGSFRDAAKILEEVALSDSTTLVSVRQVLGLTGEESALLNNLDKRDMVAALALVRDYEKKGYSFKNLLEQALTTLHSYLMHINGIESDTKVPYSFTTAQTASLMKRLQSAYAQLKYTPVEALPLEIAIVEYITEQEVTK